MRLLILGGTVFLGRALTDAAIARGHTVTHLHRGRSAGTDGRVETLFDDTITAIEEHPKGARVAFERAAPREVDLVVGADGLHSGVRELAFGPEARFERFLGYRVAAAELPGYRPRDELVYLSHGIPGAQISRFTLRGNSTLALFVFATDAPRGPLPESDAERRAELRRVFAGAGWETRSILDALEEVDDIYFDRVSQIHMPAWSRGRVALVGDAAAAVSLLAGEGTGLGMTAAYVLAEELSSPLAEPAAALAAYERRLRPFLEKKQAGAAKFASSFAPKTRFGLWFRNFATHAMAIPGVPELFLGRGLKDDFELPEAKGITTSA